MDIILITCFSYRERPLLAFEQFDFLLQMVLSGCMELGWEATWKWEDTASCLMEYQVPVANVLRKMEDVHLHDDGRNGLTFSTKVQVSTLGLGEKVFSFLTALVLFFIL